MSKAAAEAKALEDATRPPKIVPRAPKSMSAEQLAAPVFSADEFGGEVTAGGLVLPKASEAPASSSGREGGTIDDDEWRERVAEEIDLSQEPPGSYVVRDWKGDPMVVYPGDKLGRI